MSHHRNVAILLAPRGTENAEFIKPKTALEKAGITVKVIGLSGQLGQTVENDVDPAHDYPIDQLAQDTDASEFDALIIPGGTVGADQLRASADVVDLVKRFHSQQKIIASICHGPWVLLEADIINDVSLTSFASIRTDIENAGGIWKDEAVVVDRGIITSRTPDDIPAFNNAIISALTTMKN